MGEPGLLRQGTIVIDSAGNKSIVPQRLDVERQKNEQELIVKVLEEGKSILYMPTSGDAKSFTQAIREKKDQSAVGINDVRRALGLITQNPIGFETLANYQNIFEQAVIVPFDENYALYYCSVIKID